MTDEPNSYDDLSDEEQEDLEYYRREMIEAQIALAEGRSALESFIDGEINSRQFRNRINEAEEMHDTSLLK